MTTKDLKQKLGENTEKFEKFWIDNSHYYSNLESWKRGTLILVLSTLLLISIYLLTRKETPEPQELSESEKKRIEALAEERILKRMEFLRKLRV